MDHRVSHAEVTADGSDESDAATCARSTSADAAAAAKDYLNARTHRSATNLSDGTGNTLSTAAIHTNVSGGAHDNQRHDVALAACGVATVPYKALVDENAGDGSRGEAGEGMGSECDAGKNLGAGIRGAGERVGGVRVGKGVVGDGSGGEGDGFCGVGEKVGGVDGGVGAVRAGVGSAGEPARAARPLAFTESGFLVVSGPCAVVPEKFCSLYGPATEKCRGDDCAGFVHVSCSKRVVTDCGGGGSLDVVTDIIGVLRNYYFCRRKCFYSVHIAFSAVAENASRDSGLVDGATAMHLVMKDEECIEGRSTDLDQRLPFLTASAELPSPENIPVYSAALYDGDNTAPARSSSPRTSRALLEPDIVSNRTTVPLPFVRSLRYHMNGYGATYKSHVCFGGLALLCLCGIVDSVSILLMVSGHTKFAPDLVAQHVAGGYSRRDTFNHAHLRKHVEPHASSVGYDGDLLEK